MISWASPKKKIQHPTGPTSSRSCGEFSEGDPHESTVETVESVEEEEEEEPLESSVMSMARCAAKMGFQYDSCREVNFEIDIDQMRRS